MGTAHRGYNDLHDHLKALDKAGLDRTVLERVRSPIGIEIGADDPGEIAVSVVAELIRTRRLGEP